MEHALKYPGYRYQPKPTNQLKKKRNVKRNGPSDLKRCELIADLLLSGIVGDDLVEAVGRLDISVQSGVAPEGGCPAQGRDTDATSVGSVRSTGTVGSPKLDDGSNLSAPKATPKTCDSGHLDVGIAVHGIPSLLIEAHSFSLLPFNRHLHLQLLNHVNPPNISNAPRCTLVLKMNGLILLRSISNLKLLSFSVTVSRALIRTCSLTIHTTCRI